MLQTLSQMRSRVMVSVPSWQRTWLSISSAECTRCSSVSPRLSLSGCHCDSATQRPRQHFASQSTTAKESSSDPRTSLQNTAGFTRERLSNDLPVASQSQYLIKVLDVT
jgi:hypothetical protein